MTFEFETKEQREAWRVLKPLLDPWHNHSFGSGVYPEFDLAASRFDEREKTCGILPLSKEHFALGFVQATEDNDRVIIHSHGLLTSVVTSQLFCTSDNQVAHWQLTDKGREVLERLNAMCKVEK